MVPRGLIIATTVGIIAGAIFGIFFINFKDDGQLEFIDGSSLSLVTEKTNYELGEIISITIINSGSEHLIFSDASYGFKITGLDGREIFTPVAAQISSNLEPKEEISFEWDQIKNDGDPALAGTYKISTEGFDPMKNKIKNSITINIYK